MTATNLPLSGARLWDSLMQMARFGALPGGGCNRQALTDEDAEARGQLIAWGEAIGLQVTVDRLGSIRLLRPGRDPSRRPVAIGSHLDTVPTGGKFDGVYGVLAGLEILRALHEAGAATEAPLLLINWTNEEGARFSPAMIASEASMGLREEAAVLATPERAGPATLGGELARLGFAGTADPADLRGIAAYFETHIEQGPVLETLGKPIGIVTHALGARTFDVVVTGKDGHTGAPMDGRADALAAAAALILAAERLAKDSAGEAIASVTRIAITPDARGNIASGARLACSTRHRTQAGLDALSDALRAEAAAICAARPGIGIALEEVWAYPQTDFAPALYERLEAAAARRGLGSHRMPTAIGHDAIHVARALPAALMFIPCHGGLSHNEAESITPDWAEAGLLVLADAVLETAGLIR
ncbi:hydantoinase/carbamoylase family amidase [Paracraurococcus ruber]|uniref:Zn-dependent hydrolase n=1 Tax=Paracraurococcus ruber TaxID=77675 RepID=A0ABS1CUT4_9PROT|nr:hydantoinase/carbamoylase family amidase [Paracraurococcus ruber]MBK1658180.1 Zn-dependent hydrolase [Paracraurococcus ruber]TDG31809.1 hydantoinase/carbamoylase family amidase [Paracraurococcus ruber]